MLASSCSTRIALAVAVGLVAVSGAARAQAPAPGASPPPGMAPPRSAAPPGYAPPAGAGYAPYVPYATPVQGYLPAGANRAGETTKFKSPAMIGTGIGLITVGTAVALIGAGVYSGGAKTIYDYRGCASNSFDCVVEVPTNSGLKAGGMAMVVMGTVAMAVGIPVLLVGLKKVANSPDKPAIASIAPEIRIGAGSFGLSFRF